MYPERPFSQGIQRLVGEELLTEFHIAGDISAFGGRLDVEIKGFAMADLGLCKIVNGVTVIDFPKFQILHLAGEVAGEAGDIGPDRSSFTGGIFFLDGNIHHHSIVASSELVGLGNFRGKGVASKSIVMNYIITKILGIFGNCVEAQCAEENEQDAGDGGCFCNHGLLSSFIHSFVHLNIVQNSRLGVFQPIMPASSPWRVPGFVKY